MSGWGMDIYFSSLLPDCSADLTKKSRYLRRRKKSVFYFVVKSNFLLTFLWAGFGPCEKPCFFNHYLIKNYPKNGEYLTQMQTRNFPPLLTNFDNSIAIPNLETIFFRYSTFEHDSGQNRNVPNNELIVLFVVQYLLFGIIYIAYTVECMHDFLHFSRFSSVLMP